MLNCTVLKKRYKSDTRTVNFLYATHTIIENHVITSLKHYFENEKKYILTKFEQNVIQSISIFFALRYRFCKTLSPQ